MNGKRLDLRGLDCPEPVLRARQAMQEQDTHTLIIEVSERASAENIKQAAAVLGWAVFEEQSNFDVRLTLTKQPPEAQSVQPVPQTRREADRARIVVLIASNRLGAGEDDLGALLMRSFLKTLAELEPKPEKLLFLNSGVFLTTEGSPVAGDLRIIEAAGTQVLSCGTCLDFFRLKDKLLAGQATTMYTIAESLLAADRVIRL